MNLSEKEIQDKIILLGAYIGVNFTQEYTVEALPNSKAKTRRFDLIHKGEELRIIELKKGRITLNDVANIIGARGYGKLARLNFPKERIYIYFLSPQEMGIEEEAKTLIEEIPYCKYMHIEDLGKGMFEIYLKRLPLAGQWQANRIYEEFKSIIGFIDPSTLFTP